MEINFYQTLLDFINMWLPRLYIAQGGASINELLAYLGVIYILWLCLIRPFTSVFKRSGK